MNSLLNIFGQFIPYSRYLSQFFRDKPRKASPVPEGKDKHLNGYDRQTSIEFEMRRHKASTRVYLCVFMMLMTR